MSPLIHTDHLALTAEDLEGLGAVCLWIKVLSNSILEQVAHTFEGECKIVVYGIKQMLQPKCVSIIPNAAHSKHAMNALSSSR